MDYKEQAENLLYDAKDWGGDPHIKKDLYGAAQSIAELLARAEAAEERAKKAEKEKNVAIQYMRERFGWCTGCVHFTGIYGSGCKIGEMSTCGEENNCYVFCKEE